MNIYFIRHAEAVDKTINISDSERDLTPNGIKLMSSAVTGWKKFLPGFDRIVSSPYKRAYQTAQIVRKIYESDEDIISDSRLEPASKIEDIIKIVLEQDVENIALVGHEPDFSQHISSLISNSGAIIDVKKGAIAKISFPAKPRLSGGVLEFLIHPKVFTDKK